MDGRRKQRRDNYGRSQNKKPPRGSWQPKVPSWEKQFCKIVGSMDWETLLQMKKFIHLYDDVIKWNDSAGEEAFFNAKKRFWAQINGLSCDSSPPDPDLYIDKINWDSQTDQNQLFELEEEEGEYAMDHSNGNKEHDPVVIFGDSLVSGQEFSSTGWGDFEEGPKVPVNHYPSVDQGLVAWDQRNDISYQQNANAWIGRAFSGYIPCDNGSNNHVSWGYVNNNFNDSQPYYNHNVYDNRYYLSNNKDFGVR